MLCLQNERCHPAENLWNDIFLSLLQSCVDIKSEDLVMSEVRINIQKMMKQEIKLLLWNMQQLCD